MNKQYFVLSPSFYSRTEALNSLHHNSALSIQNLKDHHKNLDPLKKV